MELTGSRAIVSTATPSPSFTTDTKEGAVAAMLL